jgi:hypothetical protein
VNDDPGTRTAAGTADPRRTREGSGPDGPGPSVVRAGATA